MCIQNFYQYDEVDEVANMLDEVDEVDELYNVIIMNQRYEIIQQLYEREVVEYELVVIEIIDEIVRLTDLQHIDDDEVDDTLQELGIIDEVDDELDIIIELYDIDVLDNDTIDEVIINGVVDDEDERDEYEQIDRAAAFDENDELEYKAA